MKEKIIRSEKVGGIHPEIFICLALVLATLAVYWQMHDFGFVGYDDDKYVFENPQVKKGLDLDNFIWAFETTRASNWHPLTWVSHMLDVQLYGPSAGGHHMTSLLFHILNSLLLFAVFRKMTGSLWRSAFVAGCFALHPLNVESVAWVAERKNVLSTFLGLLALFSYARYAQHPGVGRYLPVFAFSALGLMAKPMLVTLPFVLLLLDYWPLKRMPIRQHNHGGSGALQTPPSLFRLVAEKLPLLVLSAVSAVVTVFAQGRGGTLGSLQKYPLSDRIANALIAYVTYIGKMIWPGGLAAFYPYPMQLHAWQVAGAGLILVLISLAALRLWRQQPWFGVGWLWYLGTLLPVIGLVQVGLQARADRYTYVPLIGLFVIVAWGAPELAARWRRGHKGLAVLATALLIAMLAVSWRQTQTWKNSPVLYEHALAVTSNNYVMHNNLGFNLMRCGRLEEALGHFRRAIGINPHFELAYLNLGTVLRRQGKLDACIAFYKKTLQQEPDFADVHFNLGNAFLYKGEIDAALFQFQESLRLQPDDADSYNSLGAALLLKGNRAAARRLFRKALALDPGFEDARKNLAKIATLTAKAKERDFRITPSARTGGRP